MHGLLVSWKSFICSFSVSFLLIAIHEHRGLNCHWNIVHVKRWLIEMKSLFVCLCLFFSDVYLFTFRCMCSSIKVKKNFRANCVYFGFFFMSLCIILHINLLCCSESINGINDERALDSWVHVVRVQWDLKKSNKKITIYWVSRVFLRFFFFERFSAAAACMFLSNKSP